MLKIHQTNQISKFSKLNFIFHLLFCTILFFFLFNNILFAQSEPALLLTNTQSSISNTQNSSSTASANTSSGIIIKNSTGSNFSLKLTPGVQDIFSLKIPIQLDIESFIDADRFELSQVISPDPEGVKLSIENNLLGSLKKGEKKSMIIYAEPKKTGQFSIYITGQAWQTALTLTDVAFVTINFDKNLWVTPQSDEFKANVQTWENIKTFVNIVIVLVVVLILFLLIRKFAKWWRRD